VNFPTLPNGYTVSGTITTNGATGTQLPTTDITSWDITIYHGGFPGLTFNPSSTIIPDSTFDATNTTITLSSPPSFITMTTGSPQFNFISWAHNTTSINFQAGHMELTIFNTDLPSTTPIATVPEPSSAVLASIGAVVAFLAYGWSHHRRAQRRQAAASWRPL
jgi:hypothetical protein